MIDRPKKYFIVQPRQWPDNERSINLMNESVWTLSRIIGVLSFIATALTFAATYLGQLDPSYSVYALAFAAAINAFTGRVQGTPSGK